MSQPGSVEEGQIGPEDDHVMEVVEPRTVTFEDKIKRMKQQLANDRQALASIVSLPSAAFDRQL